MEPQECISIEFTGQEIQFTAQPKFEHKVQKLISGQMDLTVNSGYLFKNRTLALYKPGLCNRTERTSAICWEENSCGNDSRHLLVQLHSRTTVFFINILQIFIAAYSIIRVKPILFVFFACFVVEKGMEA